MKITVSRRELLDAIHRADCIVPDKPSNPVLSDVLLVATGKALHLRVSSPLDRWEKMKFYMKCRIKCVVDVPGSCRVPCRRFANLVASLDGDELRLECDDGDGMMSIYGDHARARIPFAPAKGFPRGRDVKSYLLCLPQPTLKALLKKTVFCAGETLSYLIDVVYLGLNSNQITACTSDGWRESLVKEDISEEIPETRVIIPAKVVRELIGALSNNGGDIVRVYMDSGWIGFDLGRLSLVSPLMGEPTPNLEPSVLKHIRRGWVVDTVEFTRVLRACNGLDLGLDPMARFSISPGGLSVYVKTWRGDEYVCEISAEYSGSEESIWLNPDYLLDFLHTVQSPRVIACINDIRTNVVLRPYTEVPDDRHIYVVAAILNVH